MTTTPPPFGQWLDRRLTEECIPKTEAAKRIGVYPGVLSKWLNHDIPITIKSMRAIADGLNWPIADLLVASGWVGADELTVTDTGLSWATKEALLAELNKRIAESPDGRTPLRRVARRVDADDDSTFN